MEQSPTTLVSAETPRGEVALRERTDEAGDVVHELIVAGVFAMDSVDTTTETALARRALAVVDSPTSVLVGGLGLGYTTLEVLKDKRVGHVDVIELEEDLVQWARLSLAPTMGLVARHPRATVRAGDVAELLGRESERTWDLVLLDVDNGPGFLVHEDNRDLYSRSHLTTALRHVSPGGALAIWAAQREPALLATLTDLAPTEEIPLEVEREGRTLEYALYVARPR